MKYLYIIVCVLFLSACGGKQQQAEETTPPPSFEMVQIPALITEPQDRAEYAAAHYWDKFNFTDTVYIHYPEITEQAFTNYIHFLQNISPKKAATSIRNMLKKAEADSLVYAYFTNLYEHYLYDPNAPMRNEEMFITVLETMLSSSQLSEVNKIRPAHLLEIALKNRVGEVASDFTYTLANGKEGTLYGLKANYVILYFYNPDCENCKQVAQDLSSALGIGELIKRKELIVLAVYPDEDLDAWKRHLSEIPQNWINSYDKQVTLKSDEIYDLKAIPSLYLLDKDKKVLLKDATFEQLNAYLYNHISL